MKFAKDADGNLFKVRDNGTVRPIRDDDPSFQEWVLLGNTVELLPEEVGPTIDEQKKAAIVTIKSVTNAYIVAKYPEYKQSNILRGAVCESLNVPDNGVPFYTVSDLESMTQYIDTARAASNVAESSINDSGTDTAEKIKSIVDAFVNQYGI